MTSEPTLYQPDFDRMYDDERQMFDGLVEYGRLVPVKRCKHGNIKVDGPVYRLCAECEGRGFVGQDMCDSCLATDGPLGLIEVGEDSPP